MKERVLNSICTLLGIICHPLWMPTYGTALFCAALQTQYAPLSPAYWLIALLGTFALTAFIPLTLILIRLAMGRVSTLEIRNPQERTPIYIYTSVCYAFWSYFLLRILHAPLVLFLIAVGAIMALVAIIFINRHWKISAHLTGLGGLIGGIGAYCLYSAQPLPIGLVTGLLCVSLAVMYARIYTKSHTPLQVTTGLLFGLMMTFIPTLVYCLIAHV
jgi:membrane-associated phospholipid phosphatase